jgi:hypothetical protein
VADAKLDLNTFHLLNSRVRRYEEQYSGDVGDIRTILLSI